MLARAHWVLSDFVECDGRFGVVGLSELDGTSSAFLAGGVTISDVPRLCRARHRLWLKSECLGIFSCVRVRLLGLGGRIFCPCTGTAGLSVEDYKS